MSKIEKGFPETKTELEQEIQPYWRVKDMLTVYEGVIYMGDRVVVAEELRSRTLDIELILFEIPDIVLRLNLCLTSVRQLFADPQGCEVFLVRKGALVCFAHNLKV
jgi:hypothetical protein